MGTSKARLVPWLPSRVLISSFLENETCKLLPSPFPYNHGYVQKQKKSLQT